jgi:hypothetical protein
VVLARVIPIGEISANPVAPAHVTGLRLVEELG